MLILPPNSVRPFHSFLMSDWTRSVPYRLHGANLAACERSGDGRSVGTWQENRIVLPAGHG